MRYDVKPYTNLPSRCKRCQKYGHTEKKCRARRERCGRCAELHPSEGCEARPKCASCRQEHEAKDRQCPAWIQACEFEWAKAPQYDPLWTDPEAWPPLTHDTQLAPSRKTARRAKGASRTPANARGHLTDSISVPGPLHSAGTANINQPTPTMDAPTAESSETTPIEPPPNPANAVSMRNAGTGNDDASAQATGATQRSDANRTPERAEPHASHPAAPNSIIPKPVSTTGNTRTSADDASTAPSTDVDAACPTMIPLPPTVLTDQTVHPGLSHPTEPPRAARDPPSLGAPSDPAVQRPENIPKPRDVTPNHSQEYGLMPLPAVPQQTVAPAEKLAGSESENTYSAAEPPRASPPELSGSGSDSEFEGFAEDGKEIPRRSSRLAQS